MRHELIIKSLRDLVAECSCGQWEMTSPTSDRWTDDNIRLQASNEHWHHVRRAPVEAGYQVWYRGKLAVVERVTTKSAVVRWLREFTWRGRVHKQNPNHDEAMTVRLASLRNFGG